MLKRRRPDQSAAVPADASTGMRRRDAPAGARGSERPARDEPGAAPVSDGAGAAPFSRFDKLCRKLSQTSIETCRVLPKRCVARIRHYVKLRVWHPRLVLLDDGWFDDGVSSAVRNQHGLANCRQEIIVV